MYGSKMVTKSGSHILGTVGDQTDRQIRYKLEARNDWWWVLTIELEVYYEFGIAYEGDPGWTASEINAWKRAFVHNSEQTWSRKFDLRAQIYSGDTFLEGLFRDEPQPLPTVEVRVKIVEVDPSRGPANRIWKVRVLHDRPGPQVGVHTRYSALPDTGDERIGMVMLWQSGVTCADTRYGYIQSASDHEVGHMLGLWHPDGADNSPSSYGDTPGERSRIMGFGNRVTRDDYAWAKRIMDLTEPDYRWRIVEPHPERDLSRVCRFQVRTRSPLRWPTGMG